MTHWCQNVPRDEAVRAAEDKRQGPLPTLQEAIARAGQLMPQEAQKGPECPERESVTERRPPEPRGGGNVTGLRTELVTLEVTHDSDDRHIKFRDWDEMLFGWKNGFRFPGESVRVVEECCLDRINMGEVIRQRDAAIRERDKLRGEITSVLDRSEFASMELTRLRNRVAELESAPAASGAARAEAAG